LITFFNSHFISSDILHAIDALLNTLEGKQAKSENDGLERQMLLSKPQLASKIRKYQNETDVNNPNYVQGYTDIVRELISRNLPS
jgi:hypothetical protein